MIYKIEKMVFHNEEAWMIKIPEKAVLHFVVQFAALHLGVIETIKLIDKTSGCTINIYQNAIGGKAEYKICLNKEEYPISKTSLEAIAALLTRVAINGWFDTAHIDIDIKESISLCFTVEPPLQ
jgi:hypothetical protein